MSNIKINNTDIYNYGFIPNKYLESLFTLPKAEEVSFIEIGVLLQHNNR